MRRILSTPSEQLRSVAYRYGAQLPILQRNKNRTCGWSRLRSKTGSDSATGVDSNDTRLARLEAVLFLAKEPISTRQLSQYANLADGTEARTLVGQLNRQYDRHRRAFRVQELAGGMQLLTRPKFAPWIRRLGHVPAEVRLSAPTMETLAVIAYRQPVLRADVEAVRGVACGEILRQLMERDLVRVSGRSDELGRPYLYSTTKRFLQLFGLRHIDELPRVEMFKQNPRNETKIAYGSDSDSGAVEKNQGIAKELSHQGDTQVTVIERVGNPRKEDNNPIEEREVVDASESANQDVPRAEVDDSQWDEDEDEDDDGDEEGWDESDDFEDEDDDDWEEIDDEEYDDEELDDEWEEVEDDDDFSDLDDDEDDDEDEFDDDEWD